MNTAPKQTLLSAARAFMRSSRGAAAVAIAPLAVVSLAHTAHAQTVFQAMNTSGFANYAAGSFSSSGFTVSALPTTNNITGVKQAFSGSFISLSGFTNQQAQLNFGQYQLTGSVISAVVQIPIAYDFTLIPNSATAVSWAIKLDVAGDNQTVASGTGTGEFTGTVSYSVNTTVVPPSFYSSELDLTFTTAGSSQGVSVVMNSSTAALSINPQTVPEPATTSIVTALGALGLVLFRRSRRVATA